MFYDRSGFIMTFNVNNDGYFVKNVKKFVHASGEVVSRLLGIHVIIATMFHKESYQDGLTVDHINRDRQDNCISNLRWATAKEQRENQHREQQQTMVPFDGQNLPNEVWKELSIASRFYVDADFSRYLISNYCRVLRKDGNMLVSIHHNARGYTLVSVNQKSYFNYKLGCMVFENKLWHYLMEKGVPLENIEVDHRGRHDETYIDTTEAGEYCANPQKWYEEKILAVEATRKRKRK